MRLSNISDFFLCIFAYEKTHAIYSRVRAHTNSAKFMLLLKECVVNTSRSRFIPPPPPMYVYVCSLTHYPCPGRSLDFYRCGDDDDADRHGEGKHCLQQLPRRYACFRLPIPSFPVHAYIHLSQLLREFVSINECIYVNRFSRLIISRF